MYVKIWKNANVLNYENQSKNINQSYPIIYDGTSSEILVGVGEPTKENKDQTIKVQFVINDAYGYICLDIEESMFLQYGNDIINMVGRKDRLLRFFKDHI